MILKEKPCFLVLWLLHTVSSLSFSSLAPRNGFLSTSIKTSSNSGHISQQCFPLYVSIVMMDGTDWLSLEVNIFICPRDTDSTWNCSGSVNLPHTSPSVSVAQLWQKGTQWAMGKLCLIPKSHRESVAGWQWGLPAPHRHSSAVNTGHRPRHWRYGGSYTECRRCSAKRPPLHSVKILLEGCD